MSTDFHEASAAEPCGIELAKQIAAQIVDSRHFARFLRALKRRDARQVYEAVKPHLSFHVKPYFLLLK